MRGALYGYHFNPNNDWQCYGKGVLGTYVIRQYEPRRWLAIALFGVIGCICGEGASAEEAYGEAEIYFKAV